MPRNYHIWVTDANYCLNWDGTERDILEPGYEAYWTGRKGDMQGDLAFIYRRSPHSDIKYLVKLLEDAGPIREEYARRWNSVGWKSGCSIKSFFKFPISLSFSQMQGDTVLSTWGAIRRKLQGGAHKIPEVMSDRVIELLSQLNPEYRNGLKNPDSITRECIMTEGVLKGSLASIGPAVYFISDGEYIKIGVSTNVGSRMTALQTHNPKQLKLLLAVPAGNIYKLEVELHKKFKKSLYHNEWYIPSQEILDYIEGMKVSHSVKGKSKLLEKKPEFLETDDKLNLQIESIIKEAQRESNRNLTDEEKEQIQILRKRIHRLERPSPVVRVEDIIPEEKERKMRTRILTKKDKQGKEIDQVKEMTKKELLEEREKANKKHVKQALITTEWLEENKEE